MTTSRIKECSYELAAGTQRCGATATANGIVYLTEHGFWVGLCKKHLLVYKRLRKLDLNAPAVLGLIRLNTDRRKVTT